ncbi:Retrovirus-related Pol polyprotein [Collichthys lucidus]|uniref:Gypsy retrotransposon integrase-like protein 1 n=1 Tax=Collichthys lucidus TaxID=240159 RepID=A0A4U5TVX9_COLLU|nr:Retrovirus-related Pol polyprotein [Collichthys lucidus]
MDTVTRENVKVPNSLLVSGVTGCEVDDEVFEHLGQYGKIERVLKVTSKEAKFQNSAIVEYSSGGAIEHLKDTLPIDRPSSSPDIVHHIELLSELYTADRGSTLTQTYLGELKTVARLSGTDFIQLLQDELARIQASTKPQTPQPVASGSNADSHCASPAHLSGVTTPELQASPVEVGAVVSSPLKIPLPSEHLSTPEIQKVVVEHVVKSSDLPYHYQGNTRLRPFSGRIPCPSAESDYDTWRSNVEFFLADPTMSATHTTRKMVESLFPPAATMVKHLGPNASPNEYLVLLDSAYGIIDDGDELFAKFLHTNQDPGEKPAGYLQRLQTILSKVIKRGGLAAGDSDRQLLKQFCRGCWSNGLLTSLQLEQKKNTPPPFSELLLLVRSEEDRQAAKSSRMKQHFGANRTKVQSHALSVEDYPTDDEATAPFEPQKLEKQIAKLQAQVASLKASLSSNQVCAKPGKKQKAKPKASAEGSPSFSPEPKLTNRKPRPWYCFRTHLSEHPIQPFQSLDVEGANGQNVPYLGYVPITLKFPREIVGAEPEISTLALVPQSSALPGGVLECCLVTLPHHPRHKLSVWVRNENEHDVTLPSNCVIAELHTPEEIHENLPDLNKTADLVKCYAGTPKPAKEPDQSSFTIDFGDSPLSKDWKDRRRVRIPNLEEAFSVLAGSKWFSVMDLKSGYYQIEMEERDKPKTAFVCPLGFYEFNRMPQGITNAPSTFQRLMERVMGSLNLKEVLVFLDDIIVFSSTLEEHEIRLKHVLQQLRENGLKLSPTKCHFFQSSVRYLGHIVSSRGVETDPDKGPRTSSPGGYFNPKEPFNERWTPDCQKAFDVIIEKLTSAPVLGFADPKLAYVLHTDASTSGLGAALYQEQEGEMRVIAYASRGLSSSEKRYPAYKLEFLALKWSIVEKFHDYLYGNAFTVITDNNPLTYVLKSAKLDAASYRWLAALSTFDFNIKYRAGKSNQDADGLSRRPHDALVDDPASLEEKERIKRFTSHHLSSSSDQQDLPVDAVAVVCQHHLLNGADSNLPSITLVESLAIHPDAVPDTYENDEVLGSSTLPTYSPEELQQHQRSDPIIGQVIQVLENGNETSLVPDPPELKLMLKERKRLEIRSGLLYRTRQSGDDVTYQFVAPKSLRASILKSLHEDMGHMGLERTLDLVRTRFYWPKMAADVEKKIKSCGRCVRRKAQPEKSAPLVNIHTTRPMELVCIDYLSLEPDSHNTKDILVITDHFTKYAVAIPTKDQKATTVAKTLWEQFFVQSGC